MIDRLIGTILTYVMTMWTVQESPFTTPANVGNTTLECSKLGLWPSPFHPTRERLWMVASVLVDVYRNWG